MFFLCLEAWSFFKLLDADAGGCVEINEFLMLGLVERKVVRWFGGREFFQLKRLVSFGQPKKRTAVFFFGFQV